MSNYFASLPPTVLVCFQNYVQLYRVRALLLLLPLKLALHGFLKYKFIVVHVYMYVRSVGLVRLRILFRLDLISL